MATRSAADSLRKQIALDTDLIQLNNAGVAPITLAAEVAIQQAASKQRTRGHFCVRPILQDLHDAKRAVARLVGGTAENVALVQSCSVALSQVAFGLPLGRGDRVISWEQEYASNVYPWQEACRVSGAEFVRVPSAADYALDHARLLGEINSRTRIVAVSWVQYSTGAITDLKQLAEHCRRTGAWLCVDAIQGLGVIPFDMVEFGVDAVCSGAHKWLLGPMGQGFLALAPGRATQLRPTSFSWSTFGPPDDNITPDRIPYADARRFEAGAPLFLGAAGMTASIDLFLSLGIAEIGAEANRLAQRLVDGLQPHGHALLRPQAKTTLQSPIVTFIPRQGTDEIHRRLTVANVSHARRGGGIRLAPHAFNTAEEIDRVLEIVNG